MDVLPRTPGRYYWCRSPAARGRVGTCIIYLLLAEYVPTVCPSRDAAACTDLGPNLGDILRASMTPPRRYRTRRRWSDVTSAASCTTPVSPARDRRTTEAATVGGRHRYPTSARPVAASGVLVKQKRLAVPRVDLRRRRRSRGSRRPPRRARGRCRCRRPSRRRRPSAGRRRRPACRTAADRSRVSRGPLRRR